MLWRKWFGLAPLILGGVLSAFVATTLHAEVAVPALKARVTDQTQTLNAQQRDTIEQNLAALEARKGAQIAVLIVPSTEPETIEQYARRVMDSWKLGRKGVDDGALLLIAKDDRALRIETQYGLEGVIPDAIAKRIIAEDIVPHFKRDDFYGGIEIGVSRMIRLVEGEPLPPPRQQSTAWSSANDFFPMLLFGIFIIGGFLRAIFGHFLGATIASVAVGGLVWFLMGTLTFAVIGAVVAFVFVLLGGGGGGGHMGGWSSGGGGWSSGSGGGFSGGGGFGGGGGASGRW